MRQRQPIKTSAPAERRIKLTHLVVHVIQQDTLIHELLPLQFMHGSGITQTGRDLTALDMPALGRQMNIVCFGIQINITHLATRTRLSPADPHEFVPRVDRHNIAHHSIHNPVTRIKVPEHHDRIPNFERQGPRQGTQSVNRIQSDTVHDIEIIGIHSGTPPHMLRLGTPPPCTHIIDHVDTGPTGTNTSRPILDYTTRAIKRDKSRGKFTKLVIRQFFTEAQLLKHPQPTASRSLILSEDKFLKRQQL
jgi:hypothetical protein